MHRRADRTARLEATGTTSALALAGRQRVLAIGVAVVTVVLALGTALVVFQTGDLGARAVWGRRSYRRVVSDGASHPRTTSSAVDGRDVHGVAGRELARRAASGPGAAPPPCRSCAARASPELGLVAVLDQPVNGRRSSRCRAMS